MKFLLFTVFIATAAALPRWDESGAYRIIDDDSITIEQPKIEDLIKIQPSLEPYYRYYQALADPELAKYYQALTDPTYSRYYQALADPIYSSYYKALEPYYYANLPAGVQYKASQPFVYNFKLVKDIDA